MIPAVNGSDNLVGIGGPDESLGLFIVFFDEAVDCGLKIDNRVQHAMSETSFRELREEALSSIEP